MKKIEYRELPEYAIEAGKEIASILTEVSIRNSMKGLGGCKEFCMNDYPNKYHTLIEKYINGSSNSVEVIYLVMESELEFKWLT